MKTNSTCCSGSASPCDSSIAELPRYYPRQMITPDDLTLEQDYFRDRMRRHNRLLHGWGVVCGSLVCPVPNPNATGSDDLYLPWQVQIESGYVLGPYGDEIILDCKRTVDLRTSGVTGVTGEPCLDAPDPWCSQVFTNPTKNGILYIAVKYKQSMTRPVRVQPAGCGCDDSSCEYSRWCDGYEIGVLQECPPCSGATNANDATMTTLSSRDATANPTIPPKGNNPTCPDCSCGPWVGLAKVTFDSDGLITAIDNCSCRRLVISFSNSSWSCQGAKPTVVSADKQVLAPGTAGVTMTLRGTNFRCGATASFDNAKFTVTSAQVQDPQTMILKISTDADASATDNNPKVTVANLDGTTSDPTSTSITIAQQASPAPASGGTPVTPPAKPVKKPVRPIVPRQPQ
jgi:hypothetical protein